MPDEHWDNLKEIFHPAVALTTHERAAFLDKVCGGDRSLRAAVESLLKSHEETGNFVDTRAYQAAAEMLMEGGEVRAGETVDITGFFRCWAKAEWERFIWLRIQSFTEKYR